jgi:hypothetical protein
VTLRNVIVVTAVAASLVAGQTASAWASRLDAAVADSAHTAAADTVLPDSALATAAADTVLADSTLLGAKAAPPDTAPTRVTFPAFGTEPGREVGHLGLVGRAGRGVANFGSDVWAVVSGPFRSPASLMWTGAALGVASILYTNDQAILDAAVRNRNEQGMKQARRRRTEGRATRAHGPDQSLLHGCARGGLRAQRAPHAHGRARDPRVPHDRGRRAQRREDRGRAAITRTTTRARTRSSSVSARRSRRVIHRSATSSRRS